MSEEQSHGFDFQNLICSVYFPNAHENSGYTDKWDVPRTALRHGSVPADLCDIPISIKFAKSGTSIGLGDAMRQRSIIEPFGMIIGEWKQQGATKVITSIRAIKITPTQWDAVWGGIDRSYLQRLDSAMKAAPSQVAARAAVEELRDRTLEHGVTLNPKIDSKSQRRIQCSIKLAKIEGNLTVSDHALNSLSKNIRFLGQNLSAEIKSAPRW
jgi:hypothetical protein